MAVDIFKNVEVYNYFPKNMFCDSSCTQCDSKSCRYSWFLTPPKFTTLRVNTLITTVDEVTAFIKEYFNEECEKRGLTAPRVSQHKQLEDLLILDSWEYGINQIPRYDLEVIVDAACGAAVLRGANVFAPGVLGTISCIKENDIVSVYADSRNSCKRGLNVPFTDPGKLFVGNGIMKMSRNHLFQKDLHPKGIAVEMRQPASGVSAVNISPHLGLLQNLPSVLCCRILSPQPGDKVIDLCAAPGHKTTHMAALMENKGTLVALDKISRKVEELIVLCQAMKADCVRAFVYDSTKAVSSSQSSDGSPPFEPGSFDRVLLDAPCSALGQRPQIGCKISSKQIESYPKLQKKLFHTAVQLVRSGGSLVYSTCSLTTQENEDIVKWALDKFSQLELVPAQPLLGAPGCCQSSLSEIDCQKVQRFGPPLGQLPENDTIGFFIAKFVKRIDCKNGTSITVHIVRTLHVGEDEELSDVRYGNTPRYRLHESAESC